VENWIHYRLIKWIVDWPGIDVYSLGIIGGTFRPMCVPRVHVQENLQVKGLPYSYLTFNIMMIISYKSENANNPQVMVQM
jgi:hypothetical protein